MIQLQKSAPERVTDEKRTFTALRANAPEGGGRRKQRTRVTAPGESVLNSSKAVPGVGASRAPVSSQDKPMPSLLTTSIFLTLGKKKQKKNP